MALAVLLGFLARSRQLRRKDRRIAELEKEVMQAYEEILDSQKDYCELESRVKEGESDSPVISIKNSSQNQETPKKPVPDRNGMRKNRPTGTD